VAETRTWIVEHSVGPLGVGTLIVKPQRHVLHVADLSDEEAAELGPLLRHTTTAVTQLMEPDQVYVTLWSHADGVPGHVHWVVHPVTQQLMRDLDDYGPFLQVKMFERNVRPDPAAVEEFVERARGVLGDLRASAGFGHSRAGKA
jgi:diadenosine tetraphosphate (Ap4A) HIT family hydrolase